MIYRLMLDEKRCFGAGNSLAFLSPSTKHDSGASSFQFHLGFLRREVFVLLLFLIGPVHSLWSQSPGATTILTEDAFLEWVRQHHPYALQASLLPQQADAKLMKARGGFDPKLESEIDQKNFDGKRYYHLANGGFKVPTWYGLEVKGGYEWTDGLFLSPERKLPSIGQAVLGVSANLFQGLLIDQRRADLQKAKIGQQASQVERQQVLNDLLMRAGTAYWEWVLAFNEWTIYQRSRQFAMQRFEGIRESFFQGDKAAVDTLESWIQVQTWENQVLQAQLDYQKAGFELSNFLWLEQSVPLEITPTLQPPLLETLLVQELPDGLLAENLAALGATQPSLQLYQYKLAELEVDRRLKTDKLKPNIKLEYHLLGNGFDFSGNEGQNGSTVSQLFGQNYKWGASLSFPLFLRKERGDIELANLKIKENEYQLDQKQLEWRNKLASYFYSLQNMAEQVGRLQDMVADYQTLLQAEIEKFNIGESSIFLLNTREQSLLKSQLSLAKLRASWHKSQLGLEWARGSLGVQ
ncbi:MAG: TolC family protein [Saprospiraceae bacterium]